VSRPRGRPLLRALGPKPFIGIFVIDLSVQVLVLVLA
jgi:hypothetical protein